MDVGKLIEQMIQLTDDDILKLKTMCDKELKLRKASRSIHRR